MSRRIGRLLSATLATGLVLSMEGAALAAPPIGAVKQFKMPTAQSEPSAITNGVDGNRWFTEGNGNTPSPAEIGRITSNGTITEFPANCGGCLLIDIVQGPNRTLYMTANDPELLSFNLETGTFQDPIRAPENSDLHSFGQMDAFGDNIWFAADGDNLARYNITSGQFTEFETATPFDIVIDDTTGEGWFTVADSQNPTIQKFDTETGAVVDSFSTAPLVPRAITIATDGQIWFTTEDAAHGVGRLDPDAPVGTGVTPFPTSSGLRPPLGIAAAPDGTVWYTQDAKGNIARIDNAGVIFETKAAKGADPMGIVVAPNGDPWYTMKNANKIGAFQLRR